MCVRVCAHDNVTRTFTVVEGNACNSISPCLPEWKLKTLKQDQCQDEKMCRHVRIIVAILVAYSYNL